VEIAASFEGKSKLYFRLSHKGEKNPLRNDICTKRKSEIIKTTNLGISLGER
jgi:hypothetical protein